MTYVIGQPCVDVKDRSCIEKCPVDCIYEGGRSLYIHPDECVDEAFFTQTRPGRDGPLGSPGGTAKLGALDVDTPRVAGLPPQATLLGA